MSDKLQGGVLAGSVDVSLPVLLLKVADSFGKTGSVAADMTLSYWRQGGVRVAVSASDLAAVNSAHSDGGVKEVDVVNMPGQYRVDWPDAAFAAGADWVTLTVLATDTFGAAQAAVLTSNVVQSGDSFVRIGAAGAGLTALGDARVANLDATVSSRASQVTLDTLDNLVDTEVQAIKGDTAAILIDTTEIGTAGAGLTALATAANLAAVIGFIDTEVASILAAVDTEVGAIKTQTDKLTFTVANKVDANPTAINGDATSAANLAKTTRAIGRGTVAGGATTTSIPTSAMAPVGAAVDQFKGRMITFDSDTVTAALRGKATDITASTNAAAPTFTVSSVGTAPSAGDTFSIT